MGASTYIIYITAKIDDIIFIRQNEPGDPWHRIQRSRNPH